MTEIPEHLLKRAAAARAAKSGEAAPADDAAAPAAAPGEAVAPAAAAAPAARKQAPLPTLDATPPPSLPDSPVVAAARNRKRVPYWAAPVLALLPLWAFVYFFAVRPAPAAETDPLVIGKQVYVSAGCQGCHLADGAGATNGGVGQQLNEGHTDKTFKDPLAMVHWIEFGAVGGARPNGDYGDADREGGAMNINTLPGQMPAFPTLDPKELAAVVIYVRTEFGGDVYDPANQQGFTAEAFQADPAALEAQVTAVEGIGETGDPDLSTIPRAE